jgi:predicted nuclease of restriction endonuclease-like (RecB) superfamily
MKRTASKPAPVDAKSLTTGAPFETAFTEIAHLIQAKRARAFQAVNQALIDLYWEVGRIISGKIAAAEWGEAVVEELARFLKRQEPGLRGFSRRNLYLMRQFYEAYRDTEIVHALRAQLPWTHHRLILAQSKSPEEREFYLRLAAREGWSSRELERQFRLARFEQTVLSPLKVHALRGQLQERAAAHFKEMLCARVS